MEDQKRRQVEYHEREHYRADQPRFVDNSHPFVAWLNHYRLRRAVQMMRVSLAGKSVLSVCGGDGQEADFFERQGARVTVVDLSAVALEAARRRNPALRCCRMDAESLTFVDRSFDWALVRDGLHHLARPLQGLFELERVSREGLWSSRARIRSWCGCLCGLASRKTAILRAVMCIASAAASFTRSFRACRSLMSGTSIPPGCRSATISWDSYRFSQDPFIP